LSPGDSSVYSSAHHHQSSLPSRARADHALSMVLLLPPAPAARVLLGRADAVFSARSAAAFRRITVAGPPGGFAGWPVEAPVDAPVEGPDEGGGEDWTGGWVSIGLASGNV
jgi:hypothetical protein